MDLPELAELVLIIGLIISIALIIWLFFKNKERNTEIEKLSDENLKLTSKYRGIIDIEKVVSEKKREIENIKKDISGLKEEYQQKKLVFDNLQKEISLLEEQSGLIEYGLYKPHFDFDTSDKYKNALMQNYDLQKDMVKNQDAVLCSTEWTVDGSKAAGRKMTNKNIKLMLRAFNGECDAAISKVRWNNVDKMEERINKSFEALNKLNEVNKIYITQKYLKSKLEELYLTHELEEKKYQEKEEMRQRKEEAREEEILRKEIERAIKEAEDDEKKLNNQLNKLQKEAEEKTGDELAFLLEKIKLLENRVSEAQKRKENAEHRRDIIKSGYIYVISNIGAFGEDVFKIGMTRRLEPLDRVRELGDASVPFPFDVHGLIYSENAPELENKLHKALDNKKINLINNRKEFFKTDITQIQTVLNENSIELQLIDKPEAKEFYQSIAKKGETKEIIKTDIFPESL